jgi:integrase
MKCCTGVGTIITRKRKNGTPAYLAQILIKRRGEIVFRESKTFDRRQAAKAWLGQRESQLSKPGAFDKREDPPLSRVIERYTSELANIGKTKAQVLRSISEDYEISAMKCSKIDSAALVEFAKSIEVQPQTRQNYMSHLGTIFALARPAWRYPLEHRAYKDAMVVLKKLGLISKSKSRDRRPTLEELDLLMAHFERVRRRSPKSVPMQKIVAFAIFSTRRQEEITLLAWEDYIEKEVRVWVRNMKDPEAKEDNDVLCEVPPEARAIISSMPKTQAKIFPYSTDAIGAAFTRACKFLGIKNLRFHDLRHDAISRLFEMGNTIPQAASVSGHQTWTSLKRYSHLRQIGDKYAGWKWTEVITSP